MLGGPTTIHGTPPRLRLKAQADVVVRLWCLSSMWASVLVIILTQQVVTGTNGGDTLV